MSSQLEQMNERFNVRLSNRQDHVVQLDALKEEVSSVLLSPRLIEPLDIVGPPEASSLC